MTRAPSGNCLFSSGRSLWRPRALRAPNRGVEFVKYLLLQNRCNLRAHEAEGVCFLREPPRDGFSRRNPRSYLRTAGEMEAKIHHLNVYFVLGCEKFGGLHVSDQGPLMRDQRDIRPLGVSFNVFYIPKRSATLHDGYKAFRFESNQNQHAQGIIGREVSCIAELLKHVYSIWL